MASSVMVGGSSLVPVSARPSGSAAAAAPRNASRISVGGLGRKKIGGARLALQRKTAFLGNDWSSKETPSISELVVIRDGGADGQNGGRAQHFAGLHHRFAGGRGRRVFFMPFGSQQQGSRGGGGCGTLPLREWERAQREQQERLRMTFEREIKARSGAAAENKKRTGSDSSFEFALLRELEARLRAEEEAKSRKERGDGETEQKQSAGVDEEGPTAGLGASTYDLMKELEKRLKAERESRNATQEEPQERRRSGRDGREFRTGNYGSLYDYMREWDREMREQRAKLEEQWRSRERSRVNEKGEDQEREQRRGRGDFRRRTAPDAEKEAEVAEDRKDTTASASVGPDYAQSNETIVYLKNEANGAEIYLVGTSHVSEKSVNEVRDVIERVKPDFVMVELCRKRYENMERNGRRNQNDNPMDFVEQMVRTLTNGNVGVFGKLIGVGLASFYRLLSYRGFQPGQEFQVATEEGKKVGAKVVLGDQDIDTTLRNLGNFNLNMSVQDAFRFFGQRMPEDIAEAMGSGEDMFERVRNRKVVRRFNDEMEKGAPTIFKALVTDRNEVMVKALRNLKGKVVAVVGLAHVDGMEQLWQQANEKFLAGQSDEKEE